MKTTLLLAAAAFAIGIASSASAQEALPSVDATYKDIEASYGVLPEFMMAYPKTGIAGAWALTKSL